MRAPLLSLRVVGADCLHGTGLALVSQFFTVFGSLMFVVQEAVAKNNAATEDLNGKRMISFLIIFANAAAGGLYPLYRFLTAWAESGDIDFGFITSSIQSGSGSDGTTFCADSASCDDNCTNVETWAMTLGYLARAV